MRRIYVGLIFVLIVSFSGWALAENLVKIEGDQIKPALAQSWKKIDDNTVQFVLKEPKAALVKEQLAKVLAGKAMVKAIDEKTVEVKGIPADSVFKEIAKIDIALTESAVAKAEEKKKDPFASLGGSGAVALEVPDGSAALRARKKVSFGKDAKKKPASPELKKAPAQPAVVAQQVAVKPAEKPKKIVAKVLKVVRKEFPNVCLQVLVKRAPRKCEIKRWKKIKVMVQFSKLDLSDPQFQTNVGANFLRRGDVVRLEISGKQDGKYIATKVERIK